MRYRDLFESIGQPVLYHGTSFAGLLAIFADDVLRGYPTDVRRDGKIAHDGSPSVSLTRDLRSARSHAGKAIREGGRAILVFDRDALASRFGRKLRPIDILQIRGHSPDNPFTGVSEFEERIMGDITEVSRYIVKIIIDDPMAFNRFEQTELARDSALTTVFDQIKKLINRSSAPVHPRA